MKPNIEKKVEDFFPPTPIPEFLAPPQISIQDIRLENGVETIKMIPHLIINQATARENGYILADLGITSLRLQACLKCEFALPNGIYGSCAKCGCDIESKARIEGESCPIGKWDLSKLQELDSNQTGESNSNKPNSSVTPPTLAKMASTFFSSTLGWAKSGLKTVTADQFEARIEICKGCELWEGSGFAGTGRCKKCGCSTQAKLRMATEKCPIDKWGPVTSEPTKSDEQDQKI
jgi:hypothetical protein